MNTFHLQNAVSVLWQLVPQFVSPGDCVIDATVGNGKDTVALSQLVGPTGTVIGFDIQRTAIEKTRELVDAMVPGHCVRLIHDCHSKLEAYVDIPIALIVFNLGYLPGGDKTVTTLPETTLKAMRDSLERLTVGGKLAAVLYPGHFQGAMEADVVKAWASGLDQREYAVMLVTPTNQINNPPQLIMIEKRGAL